VIDHQVVLQRELWLIVATWMPDDVRPRRLRATVELVPKHPNAAALAVWSDDEDSVAPLHKLAGGDESGQGHAPTTMTSASLALTLSTSTSGSDVHSNGSGVKVTSTPPTVIVT
jgi:hypothetical protein